jgi:hypothetical protein
MDTVVPRRVLDDIARRCQVELALAFRVHSRRMHFHSSVEVLEDAAFASDLLGFAG